jgi:transcriptional regulator with XRE-family HTH domain
VATTRESIGQRVERLRYERGLSQRELAEGLERVTYAYISRIEHDTRTPSLRALRQLAERLGVTALYLETGSDRVRCPHCGRTA